MIYFKDYSYDYFNKKHVNDITCIQEINWLDTYSFINPNIYWTIVMKLSPLLYSNEFKELNKVVKDSSLFPKLLNDISLLKENPTVGDNYTIFYDIVNIIHNIITFNTKYEIVNNYDLMLDIGLLYKYYFDVSKYYYYWAKDWINKKYPEQKTVDYNRQAWEMSLIRQVINKDQVKHKKENFDYNFTCHQGNAKNRYPNFQDIFKMAENGYYQDAYDVLKNCTDTLGTTIYYYLMLLEKKLGIKSNWDREIIKSEHNSSRSYQHELRLSQYFLDKNFYYSNNIDLEHYKENIYTALERFSKEHGYLKTPPNLENIKSIGFLIHIIPFSIRQIYKTADGSIDHDEFFKDVKSGVLKINGSLEEHLEAFSSLAIQKRPDITRGLFWFSSEAHHGWRDLFPNLFMYIIRNIRKLNINSNSDLEKI